MSCIKEEQEVMATLLLDCQVQQGHLPESEVRQGQNIKSEMSCETVEDHIFMLMLVSALDSVRDCKK